MRLLLIPSLILLGTACGTKFHDPPRPVDASLNVERTPDRVARGAYLVGTIGACGACHHQRDVSDGFDFEKDFDKFAGPLGGFTMDIPSSKLKLGVPNLTNHPSGLADWSDDEIIRAIRDGVRPDGTHLLAMMPVMQYQYLSDEDAQSIVAYLRTTAPIDHELNRDENEVSGLFKMIMSVGPEPVQSVPEPDRSDKLAYGKYLAHIGHCGECHGAAMKRRDVNSPEWLSGSAFPFKEPTGKYPAPNLTSDKETGLGNYTAEQIAQALRDGTRLDGEMMQPPMSFFTDFYGKMNDEDLDALASYIASIPPVKSKSIKRELNEKGIAYAEERKKALAERKAAAAVAGVDVKLEGEAGTTFATYCVACHGETGSGDGPMARALTPRPANFADADFWKTRDDDHLKKVIHGGGTAVNKSPVMAPYGAVLDDGQIEGLVSWMRDTWGPQEAQPEPVETNGTDDEAEPEKP